MGTIGDAGDQQQLLQVLRRLHERVWAVTGEEQIPGVFAEIRNGLQALAVGSSRTLVHLVTRIAGQHEIRYRDLGVQGRWQRAGADEDVGPIVELWEQGNHARAERLGGPTPAIRAAAQRTGLEVHSLLEVPFSHGVLGLYSEQPGAFGAWAQTCGQQFGLVLSVLYHRLGDLEMLGSKERQLRHVQRLQLVGQLTTEVAHDLNNPLSVIMGECAILLSDVQDSDVVDGVQAILRAAQQARGVSNRLLEFVRGNKVNKDWINFNRLVQETLELVRRAFVKEGIELKADLGRNLPWVQAHEGQVQQVILNLLQNAREALQGHRLHGVVNVRTYAQDSIVMLEVEDNGPGVPEDIAQHIFEPFFTTKAASEGTGLGLSVCAGIAREHGGNLRLEPRALGTCMALHLPVRQAGEAERN